MPEPRRTFAPVTLLGVGAGVLSAVAGTRTWLDYADADVQVLDPAVTGSAAGQVPLATALSLVVLACWGVVLVTRRLVRRVIAAVGLLAALGVAATVVHAWFTLADQRVEPLVVSGDPGELGWTAWYWVAAVAAALSVLATALAVRWVRHWPEMGTRYDAPGTAPDPGHAAAKPPEDASSLDLWKAMDEGRDPTE
jgi:uncharacterized membrane protein (TIGR02234 family)